MCVWLGGGGVQRIVVTGRTLIPILQRGPAGCLVIVLVHKLAQTLLVNLMIVTKIRATIQRVKFEYLCLIFVGLSMLCEDLSL